MCLCVIDHRCHLCAAHHQQQLSETVPCSLNRHGTTAPASCPRYREHVHGCGLEHSGMNTALSGRNVNTGGEQKVKAVLKSSQAPACTALVPIPRIGNILTERIGTVAGSFNNINIEGLGFGVELSSNNMVRLKDPLKALQKIDIDIE